jgi:hypothetical protein
MCLVLAAAPSSSSQLDDTVLAVNTSFAIAAPSSSSQLDDAVLAVNTSCAI